MSNTGKTIQFYTKAEIKEIKGMKLLPLPERRVAIQEFATRTSHPYGGVENKFFTINARKRKAKKVVYKTRKLKTTKFPTVTSPDTELSLPATGWTIRGNTIVHSIDPQRITVENNEIVIPLD